MTKKELEKEAEEYVRNKADKGNFDLEQFGKAYFSESSMKQAYLAGAKPREKRIEELEKENAELKKFRQDCVKLTEDNVVMARQRAETSKQLTKAKELLRMVIDSYNHKERFSFEKDLIKVEQFVKEVKENG